MSHVSPSKAQTTFYLLSLREEPQCGKEYSISAICAVVGVASVVLLLVAVITHKLTEQCVRKKLLESLSQSSDGSPDSCRVDPLYFFSLS